MRHRAPNLFLIGSMKSGTGYLSRRLAAHPAVFMCPVKEPCYFVDPRVLKRVWYSRWRDGYWRDLERYLSLFAGAGDAVYLTDASTPYSQAPLFTGVPERILALSPQARFIYIMRDPIERTISHYWHAARWWGERRDMLTAIRCEPRYQDVSHYARQLKAYLRHVSADRIYTLTLESLSAQPQAQIRALCSWLAIDENFNPGDVREHINETPEDVELPRGFGLLHRFRRSPLYGRIYPRLPETLRRFGSQLADRSLKPSGVPVGEVVRYLTEQQQAQTDELRQLLGRDFPEWRTLYAASEAETQPGKSSLLVPSLALDRGRG